MNRSWHIAFLSIAALCLFAEKKALAMNYETYLESWDSNWQNVVQNLPPGPGGTASNSYEGVTLNIGFACYSFPGLNGLQFSSDSTQNIADLMIVVNFVQMHGGLVRVSFGGASYAYPCYPNYFISQTTGWPGNSTALAAGVVNAITTYGLNGVDFDIEDPLPANTTPQQFANDLLLFLQKVRNNLPGGKTLSITIPAQGWNTYWYYLATGAAAIPGLVDYINFMEYDIWLGVPYLPQIEADILTYTSSPSTSPPPNWSPGWGIQPSLIQLGLMPGCDDETHFLSLSDAESLASTALSQELFGVMTWDLNRDSGSVNTPSCTTYPSGYAYSIGIRNIIGKASLFPLAPVSIESEYTVFPLTKRQFTLPPFVRQPPPPHGAP